MGCGACGWGLGGGDGWGLGGCLGGFAGFVGFLFFAFREVLPAFVILVEDKNVGESKRGSCTSFSLSIRQAARGFTRSVLAVWAGGGGGSGQP